MIKNRIKLISVISVLFVILTVLYFVVISPLLKDDGNTNEEIKLLEGEALGQNSKILMFEHQPREAIQSIEVSNSNGKYNFIYDAEKKGFYVENYSLLPYSEEQISFLISHAGYTATLMRVTEHTDDFEQYGLDEGSNPAYYVLTTRKGDKHKVYIGDMIPMGTGYYARYEGRDAVYVLNSAISTTLLGSVENLTTAVLFTPFSQTDFFMIKDFIIAKYDEDNPRQPSNNNENSDTENSEFVKNIFIALSTETKTVTDDNGNKTEEFDRYKIYYPGEYTASEKMDNVLQSFMEFYGDYVVAVGKDNEVIPKETLEKYNLTNPAYELLFTHNDIQNDILISEKNEDGTYYAYSLRYNIICSMSEDMLEFLEWEFLDFVQKPIFQYNINDVSSLRVTTNDFDETFILYSSKGETTTNALGQTTTPTILDVKLKSNGTYLKDSENFRQLYMGLLSINLVTYSDVKDTEGIEKLATVKVEMKNGKTLTYEFWPYHTRRCLYTLNGKGEFYVYRDSIQSFIDNAKKVVNGESVNYLE